MTRIASTATVLAVLFSVACATQGYRDREQQGLHPTLSTSAFIEEGNLLALIVDTRIARLREDRPLIPFEIGVANKGLKGLTLTLESFRLVDESGRSYPAVRGTEVRQQYGSIDVDRRLTQLLPFMRGRFQTYELIPSHLTLSFDQPIEVEQVYLPRFAMTQDLIYFPKPDSGVRGQVFTVLMKATELEDEILIRFKVG